MAEKYKIDWHRLGDDVWDRLNHEIGNVEGEPFAGFLFGHYRPTVDEISELNGYSSGLRVAREIMWRCVCEQLDELGVDEEISVENGDIFEERYLKDPLEEDDDE